MPQQLLLLVERMGTMTKVMMMGMAMLAVVGRQEGAGRQSREGAQRVTVGELSELREQTCSGSVCRHHA